MTTNALTAHAAARMRQRSIPPVVIEWLDEFGDEYFDGHGGVVTDGTVITAGIRTKPIRRR
jgi:hypothetical protein